LLQLDVDQLENSILLFDDYDSFTNSLINKTVLALLESVLKRGRKLNINVVVINHQTRDMIKTRSIIFECDHYCLFPATNRNESLKFLKDYLNFDKVEVEKFKKMSNTFGKYTLWYIRKGVPRFYISNREIGILE